MKIESGVISFLAVQQILRDMGDVKLWGRPDDKATVQHSLSLFLLTSVVKI